MIKDFIHLRTLKQALNSGLVLKNPWNNSKGMTEIIYFYEC